MICPYCGQENPDDIEICGFCGGPLLAAEQKAVAGSQPLEPVVDVVQTPAEAKDTSFTPAPPPAPPSGRLYGNRIWWLVGCAVFVCLVVACIALVLGAYRMVRNQGLFSPATEPPIIAPTQAGLNTTREELATAEPPAISTQQTGFTGVILFSDDFSDPSSGWDTVDDTDYSTNYYNGAYRIKINVDQTNSWANPGDRVFIDTIIEVQATKNGGPDDNELGLICRYQDIEHFYYAVVSSDGYFGISKVNGDSVLLGRENLEYTELINQGLAMNTIRLDCVGDVLTLYVNGQLLDQQSDSEFVDGNVGLIAGTYDTPGADVLFDNFTVYSP